LEIELVKRKSILMMGVSTILIIGILFLYQTTKVCWLLLLWICFMPLSLWIVSGFKTKSHKYYLCHIGAILLIIGAITSSTLGSNAYVVVSPNVNNIAIEGIKVPVTDLSKNDLLIRSLPTKDLLIQGSQMISLQQGDIMIPYTTKPLIILFWIGGFIVIVQPFILIISDFFTKHK